MKVCHFCRRWMLTCNCSPRRFSIVVWIRHLWKTTKNMQCADSLHKTDLLIIIIPLLFFFLWISGKLSETKFIFRCCCAFGSAGSYACQKQFLLKLLNNKKSCQPLSIPLQFVPALCRIGCWKPNIPTMWTTYWPWEWIGDTCLSEDCKNREMF